MGIFCNSVPGQQTDTIKWSNSRSFIPIDFNSFWTVKDGCGRFNYINSYTCMDSFRVVFRRPFSKYILGKYYLGEVESIDSMSTVAPSIPHWNVCPDSIVYVYTTFMVSHQYYSPYNKDNYFNPIPDDIINDSINNYAVFKYWRDQMLDTTEFETKICIVMTKYELNKYITQSSDSTKKILLNVDEEPILDSFGYEFCSQPFFVDYTTDVLLSKEKCAQYKLIRYLEFYHQLFQRDFPCKRIDP